MTQVLTGHGCFGRYLFRIPQKEPTPGCHHCSSSEDTAQHTLEQCPAWAEQRRALAVTVGQDMSLSAVVASMSSSEDSWRAVMDFCEEVMALKESAERTRERSDNPLRARRARGRRRAQFALLQPP
ncbi:uncharacterized protein LOC113500216 [Trichoplusia ni]|uniref:Uncharacterized protein LOC113500216 n=1 Tax=Trichoplusia ni TaxID=7111 RepID=A0A7E5W954_TRINI|nr:uncharacterized protein LOC113500216 [Trichoplusia ni]